MARLEVAASTSYSEKPGLITIGNLNVKDEHKCTIWKYGIIPDMTLAIQAY